MRKIDELNRSSRFNLNDRLYRHDQFVSLITPFQLAYDSLHERRNPSMLPLPSRIRIILYFSPRKEREPMDFVVHLIPIPASSHPTFMTNRLVPTLSLDSRYLKLFSKSSNAITAARLERGRRGIFKFLKEAKSRPILAS